ncbi:hypothetical protein [Rhodococcus rhodochrous]|uniref:hypothetical protein n=1 Tax=Rhodococcus rhodochrous TaxID=1829 RepID=UPI0009C0A68B|nr:hypothetical protein [Rhodococcus rhodochrous]
MTMSTPTAVEDNDRTATHPEIARLKQELARANKRLTTTEAALDIMGKAHALLDSLSERADFGDKPNKR